MTTAFAIPLWTLHRTWPFWALACLAWMILWAWSQTSLAGVVYHGDWTQPGLLQGICATIPGLSTPVALDLSLMAWILMVVGIMLPLSANIYLKLRDGLRGHPQHKIALGGFASGYLLVAIGFGFVLHSFWYALGQIASGSGLLLFQGWIVGVAVFLVAGVFQFTKAKAYFKRQSCALDLACLTQARSTSKMGQLSLQAGLRHGFFCFMCCWALMCLMFVFWTGSIAWMLVISAAMAVERINPQTQAGVGVVLIATGTGITSAQLFAA